MPLKFALLSSVIDFREKQRVPCRYVQAIDRLLNCAVMQGMRDTPESDYPIIVGIHFATPWIRASSSLGRRSG